MGPLAEPAIGGRAQAARPQPSFGALVISLDFELHWGVRDWCRPDDRYRENLLGARRAIPMLLEVFEEFELAVTWATVGFLFARTRDELEEFSPSVRPGYRNHALSPYGEPVGADEDDDPLHFGAGLIEEIRKCPRQEVGTHTFSHYYCLEAGQTRESFRADLASARAIAQRAGVELTAIAIPRNQVNPRYADLLVEAGLKAYRGNQEAWMYRPSAWGDARLTARAGRLADAYVPLAGLHLTPWSAVRQSNGLCNIAASLFLRPCAGRTWLEPVRRHRIDQALRKAAVTGRIFHLWWHPHNFGLHTTDNLSFLREVLTGFRRYRDEFGMRSLSMTEVAEVVEESSVGA